MFSLVDATPFLDYLEKNHPNGKTTIALKNGDFKIIKEGSEHLLVFKFEYKKKELEVLEQGITKLFKEVISADCEIKFVIDKDGKYLTPLEKELIEKEQKELELQKKKQELDKYKSHLEYMFKESRIPENKKEEYTFTNYNCNKENQTAYNQILNHKGGFLTICGGTGIGKTHLAISYGMTTMVAESRQVIYYQVDDLLDALRKGYVKEDYDNRGWGDNAHAVNNSFDGIMRKVTNCDILILDDFGTQKNTDWSLSKLDAIIDTRYINELTTVITTNLSMKAIKEISERISSRLSSGNVVTLVGNDYRLNHKQKFHKITKTMEDDGMEGMVENG